MTPSALNERWLATPLPRLARWMVLAAAALLPLSAAATLQVVYTLKLSYVLLALAAVVAAPALVTGFRRLPLGVQAALVAVVVAYLLAFLLGSEIALPGSSRGGGHRDIVYFTDLLVGIAATLVIAGLWADRSPRDLLLALAAGAAAAAVYGGYQWVALHYNLPLKNVNNAINTNGLFGERDQGPGLLGWQRARGTFVEPHFLAAYLASSVPILAAVAVTWTGWIRRGAVAGLLACAVGLIAASSVPAWAFLALALVTAALAWSLSTGRPLVSGAAAATLCVGLLLVPAVLSGRASLGSLVGRNSSQFSYTTSFRTQSWDNAITSWRSRPVLGYGPGQSSVRVAYVVTPHPFALGSAQGLWASALVDAGVLGMGAWLILLGAVIAAAFRAALFRPDAIRLGVLAAVIVGILGTLVANDRVDIRVWVLLGLALTATGSPRRERAEQPDRQPEPQPA